MRFGIVDALSLCLVVPQAVAETFKGFLSVGCHGGVCSISGSCDNLTVPGDLADGTMDYSNIDGIFHLSSSSCQAKCDDGCIALPGTEHQDEECIGSAGYIYCKESDKCVRPWEDGCPIDGTKFEGPMSIFCYNGGRCGRIEGTCNLDLGITVIGGLYFTGLNGTYDLPAGCTATCESCMVDSAARSPYSSWTGVGVILLTVRLIFIH